MGRYLDLAAKALREDTVTELPRLRPTQQRAWPPASLEAERRFGKPHAKLYPFIGRKVRTPAGPGTLLQVFEQRVTVLLDSEVRKCNFFTPSEIELVSKILQEP